MAFYKLIRQPADGKAVRGTLYQTEHRYSGSAGEYRLTARWLAEQTAREETRVEITDFRL